MTRPLFTLTLLTLLAGVLVAAVIVWGSEGRWRQRAGEMR